MSNLKEGNLITLNDDKDYIIVNIIEFNNEKYLNLLLNEDDSKMMIVKVIDDFGMTLLSEGLTDDEIDGVLDLIAKKE